jgi:xylose isomerase
MNFAGRINSFISKGGQSIFDAIAAYKKMKGMTHLEFNYPEHIEGYDLKKIKEAIRPLKVNGLAMRFRDGFEKGEFSNPDEVVRIKAIEMTKKAADICRELGGSVVTVWLAFDGFDYPFQTDYEKTWNQIKNALCEVADYAKDIKISIEYKPFEPRNYSILDSVGTTLLMVNDIDRPNVGATLDFCHMMMKHDGPAFGLSLAASRGKLFGLHMNDGYSHMDSGMIFGSVNIPHALEFVYYLKKYHYDGVVFFDTFPVRESVAEEAQANITAFNKYMNLIEHIGMEDIERVISRQDGLEVQKLILGIIR